MALRNIVLAGDPILKKVCRPVTKFDERLTELLEELGAIDRCLQAVAAAAMEGDE